MFVALGYKRFMAEHHNLPGIESAHRRPRRRCHANGSRKRCSQG
jgi:hypothetical protein